MKNYKLLLIGLALVAGFILFGATTNSFASGLMVWGKAPANIHEFTGLPLDINGWTDFRYMIREQNLYQDARVIFVSSSEGDDSIGEGGHYTVNDLIFDEHGMFQPNSAINAYQTLAAGKAQIRDGYPDIILLKRGDTWEGSYGSWSTSGPSSTVRQIMASYGNGDRPKILRIMPASWSTIALSGSNIIISGIFVDTTDYGQTKPPAYTESFRTLDTGSHRLIEDCKATHHRTTTIFGPYVAFRRCIFAHFSADNGILFTDGSATPFLLEENLFTEPYRADQADTAANGYGRILYLNNAGGAAYTSGLWENTIVRRNIFDASESNAVDARTGGVFDNNLMLRGADMIIGAGGGNPGQIHSAKASNNVFYGLSIQRKKKGYIRLGGLDGGEAFNNIFTFPDSGWSDILEGSPSIRIGSRHDVSVSKNILVHHNIVYGAAQNSAITGEITDNMSNIVISDNDFQQIHDVTQDLISYTSHEAVSYANNRYYTTNPESEWFSGFNIFADWAASRRETGAALQVNYDTDPNRTPATYNQSLGQTASVEAFLAEAWEQSRANWRPQYTACAVNNYIREGFDKNSIVCPFD